MNFADMLLQTVTVPNRSRSGEKKAPKKVRSEEQIEKHRQSMREGMLKRWAEVFAQTDYVATAAQLSAAMNRTRVSVNSQMRQFRLENPPLVEVIDKLDNVSSGNLTYVYKWLGPKVIDKQE